MNITRRTIIKSAASVLALSALPAIAKPNKKPSIGFVYVAPVGNFGWTYQHDLGRKSVQDKFGDKVDVRVIDNVKEGADGERVIRQLAADGAKIIFATSFGYTNACIKLAEQFPNTHFFYVSDIRSYLPNANCYNVRAFEGRYVDGVVAKHYDGDVGYVTPYLIPEIVASINALAIGCYPKIVKPIVINSWYNPAIEANSVDVLSALGYKIITSQGSTPAAGLRAKNLKLKYLTFCSDMEGMIGENQIGGTILNWIPFYDSVVYNFLQSRDIDYDTWGGVKSGMVQSAKHIDVELNKQLMSNPFYPKYINGADILNMSKF